MVGDNRVIINGVWWFWDEEEGGLKDRGGGRWSDKESMIEKSGEEEGKA